jgi:hypothetical protein
VALTRVPYPSPNYSSRGGQTVRLVVVHTAEGATTYQSLGSYFANPASQVSSHTGIDDTPNTVGEYVPRSGKAWTQANANPYSIATELCAFAAWQTADWNRHPQMLANCAAWIAEECAAFGIPNVKLSAAQAQDGRTRGVCGHVDLGAAGGGHWDPGPAFPWAQVVVIGGAAAPPVPEEEGELMPAIRNVPTKNPGQVAQVLTDGITFRWLTSASDYQLNVDQGAKPIPGNLPNAVPCGTPVNKATADLFNIPWPPT